MEIRSFVHVRNMDMGNWHRQGNLCLLLVKSDMTECRTECMELGLG